MTFPSARTFHNQDGRNIAVTLLPVLSSTMDDIPDNRNQTIPELSQ